MFGLNTPMAHLEMSIIIDGITYQVEKFDIHYSQDNDVKGQPQHEVRGGLIEAVIPQAPTDGLLTWAKTPTLKKNGELIFATDLGKRVLSIQFFDAYCFNLTREISAFSGSSTLLVISPERTSVDDIPHENYWKK